MKWPVGLLLFFMACTASGQTLGPIELADAPLPAGARRIAYGTDPLQFGELRLPAKNGPYPLAIVIHGGCWVTKLPNLDKRAVSMEYMRPLAAALTDAGIATWNIEYRRLGDNGGGWPGTFQDVAHAADFVRTLARENKLDLSRMVAIGHSSGGHFAMWLAARPKIGKASDLYTKNPLRLSGVVDLDGPTDLKATIPLQQPVCGSPVITELIGGSPDQQSSRYHDASPIELLPLRVRQEFFAGQMFAAQAPSYEAAARQAGDSIHTTVLPEAGHFLFLDPQSNVYSQVIASVRRLLSIAQ